MYTSNLYKIFWGESHYCHIFKYKYSTFVRSRLNNINQHENNFSWNIKRPRRVFEFHMALLNLGPVKFALFQRSHAGFGQLDIDCR